MRGPKETYSISRRSNALQSTALGLGGLIQGLCENVLAEGTWQRQQPSCNNDVTERLWTLA